MVFNGDITIYGDIYIYITIYISYNSDFISDYRYGDITIFGGNKHSLISYFRVPGVPGF